MAIRNVDMAGFVASADQSARARVASDPNQQRFAIQLAAQQMEEQHEKQRTRVEDGDESWKTKRQDEDNSQDPGGYDHKGRKGSHTDDDSDDGEHPHFDYVA